MTRIEPVFLGFLLLVACGELSRTPGTSVDAGTDAGTGPSRRRCDDCIQHVEQCSNGECLPACDSSQQVSCGDESRCDSGACQPDVTPSCVDHPCNDDQRCISSYCLWRLSYSCNREARTPCGITGFCLPGTDECVPMPICDRDGTCRVGDLGAVCNRKGATGEFLDPAYAGDRCLLGRCTSDAHCPAPLTCRDIGAEVEGLGVCR